jgi:hypothetical protein
VGSFLVCDIPPREPIAHLTQYYLLLIRHVPVTGNFAHSEVRVWLKTQDIFLLVTERKDEDFEPDDPDRSNSRCAVSDMDPDFHMRWRKQIARKCKIELGPRIEDGSGAW